MGLTDWRRRQAAGTLHAESTYVARAHLEAVMPSKLIELEDGTLVEVEAKSDHSREISGGFAEKVSTALDQLQPVMSKACRPILAMCRELAADNEIESAEVDLGFSFEAEGNVYLAKVKSGANIVVKLKVKYYDEGV